MFEFVDMIDNYEQRKVAYYKNDVFEIDTCYATDRPRPYETAIRHKNFRDGEWIVLGWRNTEEEARDFHTKVVLHYKVHEKEVQSITDAFENRVFRRQNG